MASNAKKGNLFLLQIGTGVSAKSIETSSTLGMTTTHTTVDVSAKKDDEWSSTMPGNASMSLTIGGTYEDSDEDVLLLGLGQSGASTAYTIVDGFLNKWVGNFIVTNYGFEGAINGYQTYTATLVNDGAVVFTPATP